MKILKFNFYTAVLFFLLASTVLAEPKNGFSLNAGLVSHNRDCNGCTGSSTSGLSLGLDYQFVFADKFSIAPFLMSSSEYSKNLPGDSVGHGILGAQFRYWVGDLFFGGHLGSYSEVILREGVMVLSGGGGGAGLVAGWEQADGGLYVMGQLDSATINYSAGNIPVSAFRLSAGYRWK